jgi:hypothetical protein
MFDGVGARVCVSSCIQLHQDESLGSAGKRQRLLSRWVMGRLCRGAGGGPLLSQMHCTVRGPSLSLTLAARALVEFN